MCHSTLAYIPLPYFLPHCFLPWCLWVRYPDETQAFVVSALESFVLFFRKWGNFMQLGFCKGVLDPTQQGQGHSKVHPLESSLAQTPAGQMHFLLYSCQSSKYLLIAECSFSSRNFKCRQQVKLCGYQDVFCWGTYDWGAFHMFPHKEANAGCLIQMCKSG